MQLSVTFHSVSVLPIYPNTFLTFKFDHIVLLYLASKLRLVHLRVEQMVFSLCDF